MVLWKQLLIVCAILVPSILVHAEDGPTEYFLIVTGSELLKGTYADGHTVFITRQLGPLGCQCVGSLSIGDEAEDLRDALQFATQHASLILVTGGLGPTDDDITRETLSEFSGIPIREEPVVLERMVQRFGVVNADALRENLRKQTQTPEQGTWLENRNGSAVGLVFESDENVLIAVPGPPRELQPMIQDELVPYLADRFGIKSIGASITMRFVGIGESSIDHVMHQEMTLPDDLIISSLFELGRVDLTFSLPDEREEDWQTLRTLEAELLSHIGEYMYSDDGTSLENHVIEKLAERGGSLVTAEIGSGGAVAASLNQAEGAAGIYAGGFVAPTQTVLVEMLDMGTDTPFTLEDAGRRICEKTGSTWALVIGAPDATDASTIPVAIGTVDGEFQRYSIRVRGRSSTAQANMVNRTLDLLRRSFASLSD